jgi:hypothetical protein
VVVEASRTLLALALLAAGFSALLMAGAIRRWSTLRVQPRDVALAVAA